MVTPAGSRVPLAASGTAAPHPFSVVPSAGTAQVSPAGPGTVRISGQPAGASIAFTVRGLRPGARYALRRGADVVATATADSAGRVRFTDAPPAAAQEYTVGEASA